MKKYDNFLSCFKILKSYDPQLLKENVIYRMGVIGQLNLTFEFAWKLLQRGGFSLDSIAELTDLSLERVREISDQKVA